MFGKIDQDKIRRAMISTVGTGIAAYLDVQTGDVMYIGNNDNFQNEMMVGFGDRYRFIPSGKQDVCDKDISEWLKSAGL